VLYLRADDCLSGVEVACNDDAPGCFTSEPSGHHGARLMPSVVAGRTYYVVVDGYGARAGQFSLTIVPPNGAAPPNIATPAPSPTATPSATPTPGTPNGTCAQPVVLPAGGGTFTGDTSGGSSHLGAACATSGTAPEAVFAWTPSTSGTAELSTCGTAETAFDTVLFVRAPGCAAADAACSDDTPGCATASGARHGSRLALPVVAGETYLIVVDGYNGKRGPFTLTVLPPS